MAIRDALSPERIGTYESQTQPGNQSDPAAISLYAWNATLAAALLTPIHICEVVVRNAVADALVAVYGPRWPWDRRFALSLPDNRGHYSPRRDLCKVSSEQSSTGKVIPELKFAFWEAMFTARHDVRLWDAHLFRVFPAHETSETVQSLRKRIYSDLGAVRNLRNRIAHHEPIFKRNLPLDLQRLVALVRLKSELVASWMAANQSCTTLLLFPPVFNGGASWAPTHEEIANFAYLIWQERGQRAGSPEDDWFEAQRRMRRA